MNIPINKDLEEEYKDEFLKGFTLREAIYIVLALGVVAAVGALCWWKLGLAINVSVYAGFPFAAPILVFGFRKPHGMYLSQYLKEIWWEKSTKLLLYDADEVPEVDEIFSMESRGSIKGSSLPKRKKKGRKKERGKEL